MATAIVTGYSSGLGRAFSEQLLQGGWDVVGVARRPAEFEHLNLKCVVGSVAEQSTVEQAFDLAADIGSLSLVINCAGTGVFGAVGSYSANDVAEAVQGNLTGLILFTDQAVNVLRATAGGSIVNVMSTAAKKLRAAESVYTAVKWGAKAYTRTVRESVKAEKLPIRVFEVYPCGMNTGFWETAIRPVSSGTNFPSPVPIAEDVLNAVFKESDSYQQELTFERS